MTNASLNLSSGSIALGNGNSSLGNVTVGAGAMLSVGSSTNVTIQGNTSLTDNGTVSFGSGDAVTLNDNGYYVNSQIIVASGGLLTANGTTFSQPVGNSTNGGNYSQIVVNAGGHLQASATDFAAGEVYFSDGVTLNPGDLAGDAFDSPLYIPAIDVQFLSGPSSTNLRFQAINLLSDTLSSGQSVTLGVIGSQTTANLRYVLPYNFTVGQGASLAVAPGLPVAIGTGSSLALTDNGTLTFGSGDAVTLDDNGYYVNSQIIVGSGGLLTSSSATFSQPVGNSTNGGNYSQIVVNAGGHLQASATDFAAGEVYLADGVVFNPGDLAGDAFDSPLYVPAIDVQYLSGGISNNLRFQAIEIQPDTIASSQTLSLGAIGTQTTAKLSYVFPGGLTVDQGGVVSVAASLSVAFSGGLTVDQGGGVSFGANTTVAIGTGSSLTLTDNGTVSFGTGDAVTLNDNGYYVNSQIIVASGGLLTANSTTFSQPVGNSTNGGNYSQIVVNAGGHLQANATDFAAGEVYFSDGVTLNPGDLSGDAFDSPLYIPPSTSSSSPAPPAPTCGSRQSTCSQTP